MRIKIFTATDEWKLEEEVNNFLKNVDEKDFVSAEFVTTPETEGKYEHYHVMIFLKKENGG